jgi:hypothetical protein
VGLAQRFQLGDHVCGFVDDPVDRLDAIAQMVAMGLQAEERVVILIDSLPPAALITDADTRGIPVRHAMSTGQVQVQPARHTYLPDGRFDPQRTLDDLVANIERAAGDGYRGLRLVGDMGWVSDEPDGIDQLPWYEEQVNRLFMDGRAGSLCLYDRHRSQPLLLRQLAAAHPASILDVTGLVGTPLLRMRRTWQPYGLRLDGEVDVTNRTAVAAALDILLEELPDPAAAIALDVSGLRFADAATAGLICGLALRSPAGVQVTGGAGAVAMVLERVAGVGAPGLQMSPDGAQGGVDRGKGLAA